MVELRTDDGQLRLVMTKRRWFWAFHRPFAVPLRCVRTVRLPADAWGELRGWRSTGVTIPGRVALGTRRHGDGYDFVALRRDEAAVVIELNGARYGWLVLSVADADATAQRVAAAAGIAGPR